MSRIISVHEYTLKSNVSKQEFENAVQQAHKGDLLQLPGLVEYHFVKGIKGQRKDRYAAIWIYESREAWEKLWGTPENPKKKQDYPENWKVWEKNVLAPFLSKDPDKIKFTAYEALF